MKGKTKTKQAFRKGLIFISATFSRDNLTHLRGLLYPIPDRS